MKKVLKIPLTLAAVLAALIVLLVLVILTARLVNGCKNKISTENGVQESTYIDVNGIKQFIQIRGDDAANPVMIFLHGGPASPMSFVSAYYQKPLESEVTIINYDQRGCGRTYYANSRDSHADVDLLLGDLDGIVDYARERFGQDKVILTGHSWGTALGSIYAQQHPEKVSCYIGIGQMTDGIPDKLAAARLALEKPEIQGTEDEKELKSLMETMGKVSRYEDLVFAEMFRMTSISAKYLGCEGIQSGLAQIWSGVSSPDMNFQDMRWFLSQLNQEEFLKQNETIMAYAMFGFNIRDLSPVYEVPVYYIAGEGDYVVSQKNAQAYCESITAPDKGFFWLPNVGHSPFMDDPQLYCDTVKAILERIR